MKAPCQPQNNEKTPAGRREEAGGHGSRSVSRLKKTHPSLLPFPIFPRSGAVAVKRFFRLSRSLNQVETWEVKDLTVGESGFPSLATKTGG